MNSCRMAIFGLGRSGLSSAKLAVRLGHDVAIFDEKPAETVSSSSLYADAVELSLPVFPAFSGNWSPDEFDLVVTSPGVPKSHPKLLAAVANGISVISEIELAYRATEAPIIAITGTNGKSTTTVMTWLCLRAFGVDAVLCGNIYGSVYTEIPLTEAVLSANTNQVLVAEISSFQLEWIDSFRPRAAIITNLSDDHLNRYSGFEEYSATKHKIFCNMGDGDVAVWNSKHPNCAPLQQQGLKTCRFGGPGDAVFQDESHLYAFGESIELGYLPFGGEHNLENAMAALALSGSFLRNPKPQMLFEGLNEFKGLSHRMQWVGEANGVALINNSMCTNPVAVVASSKSLNRRQHLLIGGVDKDMDFAPLKEYLASAYHRVYLFGTSANEIKRQLAGEYPVFSTMADALAAALNSARSGEAVVLSPGAASLDQFADFRDRGEQFTEMAKKWLNESKMA